MGIIEPEPGLQVHGPHPPAGHLPCGPLGRRCFHIALDGHGGGGVRAVEQQLETAIPLMELPGEIRRHPEDGIDFPLFQGTDRLVHAGQVGGLEVF